MYHKFLNRMAGNRKDVYTDKKIKTCNANKKQFHSISLLVKSSKYDKWKPILISESLILFKLL